MKRFKAFVKKEKPKFHNLYLSIKGDQKHHDEVYGDKPDKKDDVKEELKYKAPFIKLKKRYGKYTGLSYDNKTTKMADVLSDHHWGDDRSGSHFTHEERYAVREYTGNGYDKLNANLFKGKKHDDDHHQELDETLSSAIKKSRAPRNLHVYSGGRSPEDVPRSPSGMMLVHNRGYTSATISPVTTETFSTTKTSQSKPSGHKYWKQGYAPSGGKSKYVEGTKFDPEGAHKEWKQPDHWDETPQHKDMEKDGYTSGLTHSLEKHGGYWANYGHITQIHIPKDSHGLYAEPGSSHSHEREYILHKNAKFAVKPKPSIDHDDSKVIWHAYLVHDGVHATRHGVNFGLYDEKDLPKDTSVRTSRQKDFGFDKEYVGSGKQKSPPTTKSSGGSTPTVTHTWKSDSVKNDDPEEMKKKAIAALKAQGGSK